MENEESNCWVSRPDVCRCCLSASGTLNASSTIITDSGTAEVLSEVLHECYGITLRLSNEWELSRMLCATCAGQLLAAANFKRQVLRANALFTQYWNRAGREAVAMKTQKDAEVIYFTRGCRDEPPTTADDDNDFQTVEYLTERVQVAAVKNNKENRMKRKRQKIVKGKKKETCIDEDKYYDSDAPIADMLVKNEFYDQNFKVNVCPALKSANDTPLLLARSNAKYVSERKRVMLTCDAVLRETTACPFRHHKSWFQCFFCSQDFMEIAKLRDHTVTAHADLDYELKKLKRFPRSLQIEITNVKCRNCQLNLTDVTEMHRHLGEDHNKVIYKECIADYKITTSPYSCHICRQEFHVFRCLTTHLNEHYANCICDICGKSFLNSKRLKVHKRTHEFGQFPCSECGKVLKTQTSKANHVASVHSKRQMKCQICLEPVKHYNDRMKHMSEAHGITHKFPCPVCSREFHIKHYLATHIRQSHKGGKRPRAPSR